MMTKSIYWDDHMRFFLLYFIIVYYIDGFLEVNLTLHSWDQSLLVMVDDPVFIFLESGWHSFICYFCISQALPLPQSKCLDLISDLKHCRTVNAKHHSSGSLGNPGSSEEALGCGCYSSFYVWESLVSWCASSSTTILFSSIFGVCHQTTHQNFQPRKHGFCLSL